MNVATRCPHCGQVLSVQGAPGQTVQCPHCGATFAAAAPGGAPQPSVAYAGPTYVEGKTSATAVLSLIFGVLFFIPLIPILAIIFGVIALVKTQNPAVRGKGLAIAGLVLGCFGMVFSLLTISILLPSLNRAREVANRVKCGANMRQIGQAILLYSNENKGNYPPRLEDLILTQDLTSDVFACPSTNDTAASGSTPQQQAANLSTGGHESYIYLGKGMRITAGANVILLYEPLTDHRSQGFNALFGDGHVEFIPQPMAQKVVTELQKGQNPPPSYRGF